MLYNGAEGDNKVESAGEIDHEETKVVTRNNLRIFSSNSYYLFIFPVYGTKQQTDNGAK